MLETENFSILTDAIERVERHDTTPGYMEPVEQEYDPTVNTNRGAQGIGINVQDLQQDESMSSVTENHAIDLFKHIPNDEQSYTSKMLIKEDKSFSQRSSKKGDKSFLSHHDNSVRQSNRLY